MKEENPEECATYKQKLANFYAAVKIEFKEQYPVFTAYLNQCESMSKRAIDLSNKCSEETDVFKQKAPRMMSNIVEEVKELNEGYKGVEAAWKDLCKYYEITDVKQEESTKFIKFFTAYFDTLEKYFPKDKKK